MEVKTPFVPPFMRDKILPAVPDQWSPPQKQDARLPSDSNYEDVIVPTADYENITLDAFEIVDDHIYDRADKVLNKHSSIYKITASSAHMQAVTQLALKKQGAQGDHQRTENDPIDQKFGRLRQHSIKDADDPPLSMSPRTAAFVPPRDVPRPHPSPVHYLNTSPSVDSTGTPAGWKGTISPPHSGSPTVASKVQESPILPPKTFAFPTMPPKDSDAPILPSKVAPAPLPKTGASPKKAPIPPPKTISEAPIPPAKAAPEAPFVHPKTTIAAPFPPPRSESEAPIPPPRSLSESEAPIPPPRSEPKAPIPPPKSGSEVPVLPPKTPHSASEAPIPPWRSEVPAPPRRSSEPRSETPSFTLPPKVPSSQSNSPGVHPKPLKRPTGATAPVPIPPPKPVKQEPPPPPPKTGNSYLNKFNESGDHGKRGLGGNNTFPQPAVRMPVNEIAQRAAALQQSGVLTASKRYYKPS